MFDAQITQVGADDLEQLFAGTPEGTPNADTLKTGTKLDEKQVVVQKPENDIPFFDEADYADEEVKLTEAEQVVADAKAKTELEAKEKADKEKLEVDKKVKEPKEDEVPVEAINTVLKNTVDFLVKAGRWEDFDGREDLEITQEVYAELAAKQDDYRLNQKFNELVDSTGDYGKAIINHIKGGGDPDVIIDLFKEQQAVKQIDTSTEDGKIAVIEKFYKEVVGFKPDKVQKDLKRLISENAVEDEFNEVKDRYDKYYKDQLDKANKDVEDAKAVEATRKTAFVNNIKDALEADASLTPQDKKLIANSILDFKHDVGAGKKVNDFYIKFAEMQANPKEYIKLVRYVMNPKSFEKAIEAKAETKAAKDTFNFVKGNAAMSKTKSSTVEITDKPDADVQRKGTDFSFLLKR